MVDKDEYPDSNWDFGKGEENELWHNGDKVRIAEYFRLVPEKQELWLVDGKTMITAVQKMALDNGTVSRSFPYRLEQAEKVIYTRFLRDIDALFGFNRPHTADKGAGVKPAAACV
jgi:hypothetical protein